ncbi:unnamed protein product [Haemonchus placei]|uniref:Uncharacterized protein n=1 Tax=Haemonchus placei TaxID=6290 RepID=A0A0N4W2L6_HAEPC|nr:unnamed protein product [Haemonchus placei]
MDYLLFAFALIGSTLACQSVPKPSPKSTRGTDTAYVTIVTNQVYNPSKVSEYMGYFPQTKIEEYSYPLGDFSNLGDTDSNGYFAFTFTLTQCHCDQVRTWVNQIVASSNYYTSGNVVCNPGGPVIIEAPPAPPATTTTAAPAHANKVLIVRNGQDRQSDQLYAPYGRGAQVAPVGQLPPVVIPQYVSAPAPIVVGRPVIVQPPIIQPVIAEPYLYDETI